MQVRLNGEQVELPDGIDGAGLLQRLNIPLQTAVAEVNGAIMTRQQFLEYSILAGDELELVTLVGGG